ncbi:glycosyltransferase [Gelidibacter sp. F2691]|nr:glycosyltransferase [Gelidibacter sp. F2691]
MISVIIPTYNRAHILGETLDSIIVQSYRNWECIVVDDDSTDNTKEIMESYMEKDSRFHYYQRPTNREKGPCSCRNYGYEKSNGSYINFLDSDDLYKPTAFENLLSKASKGIDAVVGKIELVKFDTGSIIKQNNIHTKNIIEDHFLGNISFYVCGPLWKREFLQQQEKLFDETLFNGDDWDFSMRMLYGNPTLKLLDKAYVVYRDHNDGLSKERGKLNKMELYHYFKNQYMHYIYVKRNYVCNLGKLKRYILKMRLNYLRAAIDKNDPVQFFLLSTALKTAFKLGIYHKVFQISMAFCTYKYFGKGYKFFSI